MGARGPAPRPAELHLLTGNASRKPAAELEAALKQPEIDAKLPEAPQYLSEIARAEWERIGPHLVVLRLVSEPYLAALAAYCTAYGDWVRARRAIEALQAGVPEGELGKGFVASTPQGYKQISAWLVVANQAEERMLRWAAQFGLTPASRVRVTAGGSGQGSLFPDSDPMAAFIAAAGGRAA